MMNDNVRNTLKDFEAIIGEMPHELAKTFSEEQLIAIQRLLNEQKNLLGLIRGAAHDLNNTLHLVFAYSSLIEYPKYNDLEQRRMLVEGMELPKNQAKELVNEIMCLCKGVSSEKVLKKTDICASISDLVQVWQTNNLPKQTRLEVCLCFPESSRPTAKLCLTSFSRIVFNILQNTIRYSDKKKDVSMLTVKVRETSGEVWIDFTDNGVGIAQADLNKIFNPAENRGKNGNTCPGHGIGLSSCKFLTEKILNGRLDISSKIGEGTTVLIALPSLDMAK